jgi:mycofactocin system glycosyltransferase
VRLTLDASVRLYDGGRVLVSRGRIIRLTDKGPAALRALLADTATPAQRRLGDQLVRAGMAHPRPRPQQRPATIVIPVRDRGVRPLESRGLKGSDPYPVVVVDDGSRIPVADAIRRETSGGPGVARNEGLRHVETELVAFLDSDTLPPHDWVERLAGHFDDPTVAAVAPRVKGKLLDMGERPAEVRPGTPVPYVPTAAVIMRTAALPEDPFDPELRYGEDVDLIWRLIDQGWRVRYDPSVTVEHEDHHVLTRRFLYGTSAAPLKRRHPDKLKHVVVRPWPAVTLALLAARRPGWAAATYAVQTAQLARLLHSKSVPTRLAPLWTAKTLLPTVTQFAKLASPYGAGVLYGRISTKIRGLPTISGPSI